MNADPTLAASALDEGEARFLARLSAKYAGDERAGLLRNYFLAGGTILTLAALARWLPWAWLALAAVEAVGLALFHQYKRFARFKTRLLVKLWRERTAAHVGVRDRISPPPA